MSQVQTFLDGKVTLHCGDCRDVLAALPDASVDSVVCDPPYGLGFMGRAWDAQDGAPFAVEFWAHVLRVLKPGGHLLAFSGTRTYHRMACAIEDAGFEIRDQIGWAYGSGFPKSHDVSKAIDKASGVERQKIAIGAPVKRMIPGADQNGGGSWIKDNGRVYQPGKEIPATAEAAQWEGWGTALKPAWEPIVMARKPLIGTVAENVLTHGTGAINIDGCRIGVTDDDSIHAKNPNTKGGFGHGNAHVYGDSEGAPAFDPSQGRWPANLIHDGSDEVVECFPSDAGAAAPVYERNGDKFRNTYGAFGGNIDEQGSTFQGDSGSAARFFYQAKADSMDRVHRSYEDVEISWTSDQGPCQARLLVDTAQLPGMVIGASGSGESSEWSTFLFGRKLTARFPRDTKFTTATGTSSTTDSPIWNWLMRSLTNGCTAVASNAAMNGGSHAENAENSRPSLTITSAETVSLPGASHAVSGTPLTISVLGKRASHPTVKPIDLMQYLVRLVTPKGGTVLDPFAGTGTTGEAAWREGMKAILIEREAEYQADIAQRMDLATKPTKRAAVAKTKNNLEQPEDLPLFGGAT